MDYLFENLNDERFQEFCAALINKKFSNVQSFPVGQPDGGRDSLAYINNNTNEFVVFQVKYVKNPKKLEDPHKWLLNVINLEKSKIEKLIPKGAVKYILITNVSGTAHLESGSIDLMNKLLTESISIPSFCWWRDDLARLIEEDPIFKWNFPEILNGQDLINNILFNYINKDQDRIKSIISAYLTDQYEIDSEVKFKQIDLHNKTLDLFVDVPIRVKKIDPKNKLLKRTIEDNYNDKPYYLPGGERVYNAVSTLKNAAEFLLDSQVQKNIERILLEAGPGQGKSTISQFICQVNRIKLLNKTKDKVKLSQKFLESPVRFPIKIDLRHVASWINKRNPYEGAISSVKFNEINNHSLESFLQCHFIYHSKFDSVTVEDVISTFKSSSVLIVFDGFDEIADLKLRQDVIDFINKGINRLQENSVSIQVIVTSRPAAFTENADFPLALYPRFELTDLNAQVTSEYVDKWTLVNKLDQRETLSIKNLVKEKIQQAHIRELTKSPMQLAIFLSLLRTRGESLPNKRTALYDSYIELFFNRESEKNHLIREKRDLIINIHEYLGWLLHSEAESLQNNGIITVDELKTKLNKYLISEGHDTTISGELFDVVKERVCALVSRTQGTFEFEVQPLREYFCAKYLYNTAPYSRANSSKIKGTKPDIFKAIIRNVYWQNVTRFFAGCFDKGELPMLIFEINELSQEIDFKNTSYVKLITSQLLSDWVFTQYPNLLKDVIKIIIDGISKGDLISQDDHNVFSSGISIPVECGRSEMVNRVFDQLICFPPFDYAKELINLLINNPDNNFDRWLKIYSNLPNEKLEKWFLYGYRLGVLHNLDEEFISSLLNNAQITDKNQIVRHLVNGNAIKESNFDANLKKEILNDILEERFMIHYRGLRISNSLTFLSYLSYLLNPSFFRYIVSSNHTMTMAEAISNQVEIKVEKNIDVVDQQIQNFLTSVDSLLNLKISEIKNNNDEWIKFFDNLIKYFGYSFSAINLCIHIIKFNSKRESFELADDLFDEDVSLYKRFKTANYKSTNPQFWRSNIDKYKNTNQNAYLILVFLSYASPKIIIIFYKEIEEIIKTFSEIEFIKLTRQISSVSGLKIFAKKSEDDLKQWILDEKLSNRFLSLISSRFNEKNRYTFILDHVELNKNLEIINAEIIPELCFNLLKTGDKRYLDKIKHVYKYISSTDPLEYFMFTSRFREKAISIELAKLIMKDAKAYPQLLISIAEKKCYNDLCTKMIPVGEIAQRDNWFQVN